MKRYDSYKPSGIAWIGEIPNHWEMRKIRSLYALRSEKVSDKEFEALSVSKEGITPQLDTAVKTDNGDNRKLVRKGDFVVNSRSDRKGSCGVSPFDGSVSLINIVVYPISELNKQYYHLLFRSNDYIEEFYRLGRGIVADLWTTRYDEMRNIQVPFPPLAEQTKIVEFLTSKTSQIDAQLAERERELQLLNELKQAEIANIVTHGLNPDVPMKDSGIPWIGQIPEHWEVKRLGTHFHGQIDTNSEYKFSRAYKFNYGTIVPKNEVGDISELKDTYIKYSILQPNDIVINGLNLNYDFVSQRVAISDNDCIITSAYIVLRPYDSTYAKYFLYLFKSMDSKKLFHGMGTGIRLTLSFNELKSQMIPIPPLSEQRAIVEYIENKVKGIDDMVANLQAEIDYLKEYKQRLIADCVTGQVKVE